MKDVRGWDDVLWFLVGICTLYLIANVILYKIDRIERYRKIKKERAQRLFPILTIEFDYDYVESIQAAQ